MSKTTPIIWWVKRDLRLADNPCLSVVAETGRPVIPIFILDEVCETYGAAPKWRLGQGLEVFASTLEGLGSKLIFRQGKALEVLRDLIKETGAGAVHWGRAYDPDAIARDKGVKTALQKDGIDAVSHAGHLLFEPWTVETGSSSFYRVYSPFWRAVRDRELGAPLPAVGKLIPPENWPATDTLADLALGKDMRRGASIVVRYAVVGEAAARERLDRFIAGKIEDYGKTRDIPSIDGTSGLSENLTNGEISPRTCWWAGWRAFENGKSGAEKYLKELIWREFSYHLVYHTPHITSSNWRDEWDSFPWSEDDSSEHFKAWCQGRTGVKFVDAAMRELYVTGTMHNRARMIVASYLTKHLMTHWKLGMNWFADCLIDWDPAANAMGWQWTAGSGPDAAPYFRVFNPDTQAEKFDKSETYRSTYLAECYPNHGEPAAEYFDAIPKSWGLSKTDPYPEPIVTLDRGRKVALEAYAAR